MKHTRVLSRPLPVAPCNLMHPLLVLVALGCAEGSSVRDAAGDDLDGHRAAWTAGGADAGADAAGWGETRVVPVGVITGSPPPASCVAGLPALLPDCSPDDPAPHGLDCDGDGVLDYRVHACEVASASRPDTFAGPFDCAPDDPGLRHWVIRDDDGDGFGAGQPSCAGPGIPEGYIALGLDAGFDCDDATRAVHPGATDVWGDGFDADCSNSDFPACSLLSEGLEPERAPLDESCGAGPDLYLSSIAKCGGPCLDFGALWGFVGNAGATAAPGPIFIGFRDDRGNSGRIEVAASGLEPGASTGLFRVPFAIVGELELWVETDDCAPDNDRYLFDHPRVDDSVCLK